MRDDSIGALLLKIVFLLIFSGFVIIYFICYGVVKLVQHLTDKDDGDDDDENDWYTIRRGGTIDD